MDSAGEHAITGNTVGSIDWSVASKPFPGQTRSGDLHVVTTHQQGVFLAVIDGLGHGPDAAEAAELAATILAASPNEDIIVLMRRCDAALKPTRGAVMSVATVEYAENAMTWGGIGNVNAVVFREDPRRVPPRQRLAPRPGVIGSGLALPTSEQTSLFEGDVLVFTTDGITSAFVDAFEPERGASPQAIADRILEDFWARRDDALVLVARYHGN